MQLLSPLLIVPPMGSLSPRRHFLGQRLGGPGDGDACSDQRAKKAAGPLGPAVLVGVGRTPVGRRPISCADGLIPSAPWRGRPLLWREGQGRAAGDMARQAAFAFFMALQVRQMESPFLYM
jgi:hypothetical protein